MESDKPKENPLSAGFLAEEAEQGACGVAVLPSRLDRYAGAHQRALSMADYAANLGERTISERLTDCGHWLAFRHYYTLDTVRLHAAFFCKKHLLCPLCAIRRGAKYLKAYMERLQTVQAEQPGLKAYMVTLTVKDGPDLLERFQHLRGSMKRMTQARRDHLKAPAKNRHVEFAKALGGVHSIEAKRGANSGEWHPHAHMVWLCHEAPDAAKLSQEWLQLTGDSFIVDVRPFHQDDMASGFAEVFKYALKFSDLPLEDNWHAFQTLSGKRLVDSFGCLRGVQVSEDFTDEPISEDLPYIEMIYCFMNGVKGAYSLTKFFLVDDPCPGAPPPVMPQKIVSEADIPY